MAKLLTLIETGEMTHRTVKALRELIHKKRFPSTRVGSRIFVDSDELDRFLKLSRTVTAEQAAQKVGEP